MDHKHVYPDPADADNLKYSFSLSKKFSAVYSNVQYVFGQVPFLLYISYKTLFFQSNPVLSFLPRFSWNKVQTRQNYLGIYCVLADNFHLLVKAAAFSQTLSDWLCK